MQTLLLLNDLGFAGWTDSLDNLLCSRLFEIPVTVSELREFFEDGLSPRDAQRILGSLAAKFAAPIALETSLSPPRTSTGLIS